MYQTGVVSGDTKHSKHIMPIQTCHHKDNMKKDHCTGGWNQGLRELEDSGNEVSCRRPCVCQARSFRLASVLAATISDLLL